MYIHEFIINVCYKYSSDIYQEYNYKHLPIFATSCGAALERFQDLKIATAKVQTASSRRSFATICFATPFARVAVALARGTFIRPGAKYSGVRSRSFPLRSPCSSTFVFLGDVPQRADMYSYGEEVHD